MRGKFASFVLGLLFICVHVASRNIVSLGRLAAAIILVCKYNSQVAYCSRANRYFSAK